MCSDEGEDGFGCLDTCYLGYMHAGTRHSCAAHVGDGLLANGAVDIINKNKLRESKNVLFILDPVSKRVASSV